MKYAILMLLITITACHVPCKESTECEENGCCASNEEETGCIATKQKHCDRSEYCDGKQCEVRYDQRCCYVGGGKCASCSGEQWE
jgi:hypothetical protein